MIIRPAARADLKEFYGVVPPTTMKALVGIKNGKPVAVGGYYLSGSVAVAFTDISKDLGKKDMIRGARAMIALLKTLKFDVVARSDTENATILKHFGFKPRGRFWRLD